MKTGAELIMEERQRRMAAEGWTLEREEAHQAGEMPMAAASLCPDRLRAGYGLPRGSGTVRPTGLAVASNPVESVV